MPPLPKSLPRPLPRRLAAAAGVLLAPLLVWAVGLPRPVYIGAWILGAGLALCLILRGRRASFVPGLALAFVAVCLALALGDLLLRTPLASRLFPRPQQVFSRRWPENPDLARYQPNLRFEGNTFGDLAAMTGRVADRKERRIVFSTDARGFRNPPPPPEGPLEAILLGDSFGVGGTTPDDEIWVSRLRQRGIRISSLSAPGGPWGALLTLKTELPSLALQPGATLLWALFTGNDLDDRYRDYLEAPPRNGPLARADVRFTAFRRRSPLRQLWIGRLEGLPTIERARHDPSFLYLRPYQENSRRSVAEVKAHENFPRLVRVFASMAELARERGLRVVVAMVPTKWETYAWLLEPSREAESERPSGFASVVEGLCRQQGFTFVDLKPALVAEARRLWPTGETVFWRDDTHWNGHGQRVAAQGVAPLLAQ